MKLCAQARQNRNEQCIYKAKDWLIDMHKINFISHLTTIET